MASYAPVSIIQSNKKTLMYYCATYIIELSVLFTFSTTVTLWCAKTLQVWLKMLYIPFFSSVFLLIPIEPQNKICTAYSQGTSR